MKKKNLYLILAVISIISFFSIAATCKMCGISIGEEKEEAAEEEEEEATEEEEEEVAEEEEEEVAEEEEEEEDNHNPVITNVIADEEELDLSDEFRILVGVDAIFLVQAEDQDADELFYSVSDSDGNNMETERIDNNTARFGWIAPSDPGLYEIYIQVSDANGGETTATVHVTVNPWGVVGGDDEEDTGGVAAQSLRSFEPDASISGQVIENGEFFIAGESSGAPYIYVGDTVSQLKVQGFLSFNVSSIAGKNVLGARLNINAITDGDPTSLMRELSIVSTDYGDSLSGEDYGSPAYMLTGFYPLSGTDFSFTNENLINAVQDTLTAGIQYFQVKLYIGTSNSNHVADGFTIYISDVSLRVEYN